jgi:arylsulfatase A-like enzyme
MGPTSQWSWRARLGDAAAVLVSWAVMLLAENVALGVVFHDQFTAAWELVLERRSVIPMVTLSLVPGAMIFVLVWEIAARASEGSAAMRWLLGLLGVLGGAALGYWVSGGRHFASWEVRGPFLAVVATGAGAVAYRGLVAVSALERRPYALGGVGLLLAISGWVADEYVLARLYPAFHVALFVASLFGGGAIAMAMLSASAAGRSPRWFSVGVGLALLLCVARVPAALTAIDHASNVRIALVDHAPMAGRFISVLMRIRPPADTSLPAAGVSPEVTEVPRSLDWTGRDLLLVSVDALRADHVSAYGYARPTTPNLDALAREGTLFESAYCPTPHTSYSITSMLTGKYLRPLLALGLGSDSETWAMYLRRYGWRTAAFYPPAVFFIDQERFESFEHAQLGFEYAKVEFAAPPLREQQVKGYLDGAPTDRPLFLWVHFFEPHEPYVPQPGHVFEGGPSRDVDLYDGEVATADDGIGRIVRLMRARRPGAVVIVTADHGEEFGEHGGRYHGTTVYEEQVRVPLVVVGPGVRQGARTASVAQTIDLLPTVLSALGIPRPARLRGRDLGPTLAGKGNARGEGEAGFALAETDDASLVASGGDRLICERRAAACALYRPKDDPLERKDVADQDRAAFDHLRSTMVGAERDHGRLEGTGAAAFPPALRRGMQGDTDAAADVAGLLDDADVAIRRAAAEVCYGLHADVTRAAVHRALGHDEDDTVRRWSALALERLGEPNHPAETLATDADVAWRRRAALAFAEQSDPRGCDEIASWWNEIAPTAGGHDADGEPRSIRLELARTEELLAATARARCKGAVAPLVRGLEDVRARPFVADTLGALGDRKAAPPLLEAMANERYMTVRPHEARALLALGVRAWAPPPGSPASADARVQVSRGPGDGRVLVLLSDPAAALQMSADGAPLPPPPALASASAGEPGGEVRAFDLAVPEGGAAGVARPSVSLQLHASTGTVEGIWMASPGPP